MQNKHLNITYAYHFLSEAIILLLIATPILYLHYRWIPYWSYLMIILISCIVFSLLSKRTANYRAYLLMAIPLFIAFYLLHYPFIVNVAFTCFLIWRYIDIRSRSMVDLNRENGYIILTIILTTIGVLIVRDGEIIIYASMQVIGLIFGNIYSHLAVIKREDRRRFDIKTTSYIIIPLFIGTVLLLPLFQSGKFLLFKLWDGFRYAVFIIASLVGNIIRLFEQDRSWSSITTEESGPPSENPIYQKTETTSIIEILAPYALIGAGIVISGLIIFFAIKAYKKVKKPLRQLESSNLVTYSHVDDMITRQNFLSTLKRRYTKPQDPIRRIVFDFERKAIRLEKGRKPFETIEEWLRRIGYNANLEIYQKARYGEEEVSNKEVNELKIELKKLESSLQGE